MGQRWLRSYGQEKVLAEIVSVADNKAIVINVERSSFSHLFINKPGDIFTIIQNSELWEYLEGQDKPINE